MTSNPPLQLVPPLEEERSGHGRRRLAFVGMAWVSVAFVAASAAPSPLYVLYQAEWHFGSQLLTFAFSIYAFTLLAALLTVGSLSDHLGRRPVLVAAIVLELVALLILLFATDVSEVLVARALQGFATGAATAAVSAALSDLSPKRNRLLGTTVASITPLAGLAIGALSSGLVVLLSKNPIQHVFAALVVALVIGLIAVLVSPETVSRTSAGIRTLIPRLHVPASSRSAFLASSFLNVAVWLTTSLSLGLLPQINRDVLHFSSGLANGALIALLTAVGALSVVASRRLKPQSSAAIAAAALAVGAVAQGLSALSGLGLLFAVGCVASGIGAGVGFGGYIRLVMATADPDDRAGVFSAMYVVSYLTFGLPVILAGFAIPFWGTGPTAAIYCGLTVVASGVGLLSIRAYGRAAQETSRGA